MQSPESHVRTAIDSAGFEKDTANDPRLSESIFYFSRFTADLLCRSLFYVEKNVDFYFLSLFLYVSWGVSYSKSNKVFRESTGV